MSSSTKTEADESFAACADHKKSYKKSAQGAGTASGMYCLGVIGSFVYWMQSANQFGAVVTGILKSLVWPAYIVYKLLEQFYGRTG